MRWNRELRGTDQSLDVDRDILRSISYHMHAYLPQVEKVVPRRDCNDCQTARPQERKIATNRRLDKGICCLSARVKEQESKRARARN